MDHPSSARGPAEESSWAAVARTRAANTPRESATSKSEKVTFKLKANKGGDNGGQRTQLPRQTPRQPAPPRPQSPAKATFTGKFLEQAHAAEQSVSRKPEPASKVATAGNDAKMIATLNATITTLEATVATLNEDMTRRSHDLIQAKAALKGKDSEIESLKERLAVLEESLESVATASKTTVDESSAKDSQIMELQLENAGLRDAIHTGLISVAQIYGPGSEQAFTHFAEQEAKSIKEATKGLIDGHHNGHREVSHHAVPNNHPNARHNTLHSQTTQPPDLTSPPPDRPLPSPKKDDVSHRKQTVPSTTGSKTTEPQKENRSLKDVSKITKGVSNRPTKVDDSTKTTTRVEDTSGPKKNVTQLVKKVDHPTKHVEQPMSEAIKPITKPTQTAPKAAHPAKFDSPTSKDNGHNGQQKQDSGAKEAKSDLDATTKSSPIPTTSEQIAPPKKDSPKSFISPERKDNSVSTDDKSTDSANVAATAQNADGKYAIKVQESVDIMAGVTAPPPKPLPHMRGIDEGENRSRARGAIAVVDSDGKLLGMLNQDSTKTSPSAQQHSPPEAHVGENGTHPNDDEGWESVQPKNKPKKKKTKAKGKAVKKPDAKENGGASNSVKTQTRKSYGTVIGSNSAFSKSPKEQKSKDDAASEKSEGQDTPTPSQDPKVRRGSDEGASTGGVPQKKTTPPGNSQNQRQSTPAGKAIDRSQQQRANRPANTTLPKTPKAKSPVSRSWADEVEEYEASSAKPGTSLDYWTA
ncbi:hypothetical protein GGS26DRAFT_559922 [Hypomontagnella submonticulosa]|nr:hypothetical protein GGS26DRAFT_559922 [Hypomontagnella submonticulosa]